MCLKQFTNQLAEVRREHDILPIVFTYCQPEDGDRLLTSLVEGGFSSVLYVDNGSPSSLCSSYANLIIPKNIGLSGQIRMALAYAMEFTPARYYWLLTTSVDLAPRTPYRDRILAALEELSDIRPVIYSPSLDGPEAAIHVDLYAQTNCTPRRRYWICRPTLFQMVAMLIEHDFCELLQHRKAGVFNPGLSLGWGLDVESVYLALTKCRPAIADRELSVRLEKHRGQKRKRYSAPRGRTGMTPIEQLNLVFRSRYGNDCWERFETSFLEFAREHQVTYGVAEAPRNYWVNGIDGNTA